MLILALCQKDPDPQSINSLIKKMNQALEKKSALGVEVNSHCTDATLETHRKIIFRLDTKINSEEISKDITIFSDILKNFRNDPNINIVFATRAELKKVLKKALRLPEAMPTNMKNAVILANGKPGIEII